MGVHRKRLSSLKLKYDPYSAHPEEDYETLKTEISNIDLMLLLEHELAKSTVHIHSARRIVSAMRFSQPSITVQTAETLIDQLSRLYPIAYLVLDVVRSLLKELDPSLRISIKERLLQAYSSGSFVFAIDYHLIFLVRALVLCPGSDTLSTLESVYSRSQDPLVRREVILAMHHLNDWAWLSNLRKQFSTLTPPERRAFLVASFDLADEGKHWRKRIKRSLAPFELLVLDWAATTSNRELA